MSQAVPSEKPSQNTAMLDRSIAVVSGRPATSMVSDPYTPSPAKASRVWWVATGLLVLMAGLFGGSVYLGNELEWVRMLRAFSEAALVGALADWFAVTALFRYPLGLPIPHTGIIPNNKTRIGKSLGLFVQRNFLTAEVLDEQVVNISGSFARFLQVSANRERVVGKVRALIPKLLEVMHDADIKKFLNDQVEEVVRSTNLARASAKGLRMLTSNQMHEVLLDELLQQLQIFFRSNQLWFRQQLREASPWFVPEIVDRKIFDSIVSKTEQTFSEALSNRNHEFRRRLLDSLYGMIIKLETSEDLQKKGEEFKQALLASEGFREYLGALRDGILAAIDTDSKKRDSVLLGAVEKVLLNIVDTLSTSPKLQHKLNRIIRGMLSTLVGQESTYVADLIAKTIEGWDTKTLVSKLEEQVGADLQYIRINGTLVGGLVGLALYGVAVLVQK